jgi:hypothetical protein
VFFKNTPLKEPGMISKKYQSKTAYGKKPPILSCDPATLGVPATDHKCSGSKNVINLHFPADLSAQFF